MLSEPGASTHWVVQLGALYVSDDEIDLGDFIFIEPLLLPLTKPVKAKAVAGVLTLAGCACGWVVGAVDDAVVSDWVCVSVAAVLALLFDEWGDTAANKIKARIVPTIHRFLCDTLGFVLPLACPLALASAAAGVVVCPPSGATGLFASSWASAVSSCDCSLGTVPL